MLVIKQHFIQDQFYLEKQEMLYFCPKIDSIQLPDA